LAAVVVRQERSAMLDSLRADYVRTARAKGLEELRVVGVHALRNSLMTVITVVGLRLGELLGGAVVIEQIFVIPGFGNLIVQSIFERDYPVVEASPWPPPSPSWSSTCWSTSATRWSTRVSA